MSSDRSKMNRQDIRVLAKTMVYCSGIPSNLTSDELKSDSYFGKYGQIDKIIITPYPNRNYCSAYITYQHQFQAATAILSCNEFELENSTLWCLFGTMKYCRFFLKKIQCKNIPNCPYLHLLDKKNQISIKNSPAEAFPQHQQLAIEVLRKHPQKIKQLLAEKKVSSELPSPLEALQFLQDSQAQEIDDDLSSTYSQKQFLEVKRLGKKMLKKNFCLQNCIKKMILYQISKNNGSRIMKGIKDEEKTIKDIIISGLSK